MHRIDGPGATGANTFTSGNPSTGVPATTVTPEWLTALQEEIAYVITQSGASLVKADNTQLDTALKARGLQSASTTLKGVVQLATSAEAQALSNTAKAITPDALNMAFKAANQSLAATGYQKLPGGLIIQWAQVTVASSAANAVATLPVAFPTVCVASSVSKIGAAAPTASDLSSISVTTTQVTIVPAATVAAARTFVYLVMGY